MTAKQYPDIFYPTKSESNFNFTEKSNTRTGYSETYFEYNLKKYFAENLLKDLVIDDGRKFPYHPDFIISITSNKLLIDIEIDEPYTFLSSKPIHINDDSRNQYFLKNGWGIIRFSEEQTVKYPQLCCKIISEYIRNQTQDSIWYDGFHYLDNLEFTKAWTMGEATSMAKDSYRNTYLNLLQSIEHQGASIHIIADGIFLDKEVKAIQQILKTEESINDFNKAAKISIFLKTLSAYIECDNITKNTKEKIYVEFTIYISRHHSLYLFSFDTDFLEFNNFIVNIYYIRTSDLICFRIFDKLKLEIDKPIYLIADDPAYGPELKNISIDKLVLIRKFHNTTMPNNIPYIDIAHLIEKSLEIKYVD